MKKPAPITLRDIFAHRSLLYGLAGLWILFYHMKLAIPDSPLFAPLKFIHDTGTAGADMFVMLSGFGLYRSLSKNHDLKRFYLRRLQRVALPTVIVTVVFGILLRYPARTVALMLPVLTYWLGFDGLWFSAFILLMYLVYPAIYALQRKHPKALWVLFWVFVAVAVLPSVSDSAYLQRIVRALERIPAFLFGCILAPKEEENAAVPRWVFPGALGAYILLSVTLKPLNTLDPFPYFTGCFLLAVCVFIAGTRLLRACASVRAMQPLFRILAFCGGISLELYLCYGQLEDLVWPFIGSVSLRSLCAAALTIPCAWLLRSFCIRITRSKS